MKRKTNGFYGYQQKDLHIQQGISLFVHILGTKSGKKGKTKEKVSSSYDMRSLIIEHNNPVALDCRK